MSLLALGVMLGCAWLLGVLCGWALGALVRRARRGPRFDDLGRQRLGEPPRGLRPLVLTDEHRERPAWPPIGSSQRAPTDVDSRGDVQ